MKKKMFQAVVELNKDVESIKTYNGQVRELSKSAIEVSPPQYGRTVSPGATVQFQIHVTFTRGSASPKIQRIAFNEQEFRCSKKMDKEEEQVRQGRIPICKDGLIILIIVGAKKLK